ncbi:MAG: hypothetical protein JSV04_01210 [Candidatus Heimdallarchaeota archaeon]|nr:MAG: hypothetical protein JSV04_01210 [Candidatus Heimdallarchaeota archaeon]
MGYPDKTISDPAPNPLNDTYQASNEQQELWFLGSLMQDKNLKPSLKVPSTFDRLAAIHNRITKEGTGFDERFQANLRVATHLSQFFPYRWLTEITATFRDVKPSKLGIKTYHDRVCSYLGYIELYLAFRGLTLLDSTLEEINTSFQLEITKNIVRHWKLRLLRIIPSLREEWIRVRSQTQQSAMFATVVKVMNSELVVNGCSKRQLFDLKQACLQLVRQFVTTSKARHIKNPEGWARAICVKAVREVLPEYPDFPFPHLPKKSQKVINHKRWQIDQILSPISTKTERKSNLSNKQITS